MGVTLVKCRKSNGISTPILRGVTKCIYFFLCNTIIVGLFTGGNMKKLLFGIALGAAVGMVVSEIPAVKQVLSKGKKKVKNLTK